MLYWQKHSTFFNTFPSASGIFDGGLNAILGSTGSGKSSLLDVLAGRKDPKNITGTVLYDGKAVPSDFRLIAGYVVQVSMVAFCKIENTRRVYFVG